MTVGLCERYRTVTGTRIPILQFLRLVPRRLRVIVYPSLQTMSFAVVLLLCAGVSHLWTVQAALKQGDCEVCLKFMTRMQNDLEKNKIDGNEEIQRATRETCASVKDNKENRFCYYIGGSEDSATGMLRELSDWLGSHYPPEKICEKMKKRDPQICELKYDKPLDWKNINLKKMRVKELKKILSDWDETCRGCVEKQDFIDRIEELKPHYVRDEL